MDTKNGRNQSSINFFTTYMIINLMNTKIRKNLEDNQKKETLGSQIKIMDPEFISSTDPLKLHHIQNNVSENN